MSCVHESLIHRWASCKNNLLSASVQSDLHDTYLGPLVWMPKIKTSRIGILGQCIFTFLIDAFITVDVPLTDSPRAQHEERGDEILNHSEPAVETHPLMICRPRGNWLLVGGESSMPAVHRQCQCWIKLKVDGWGPVESQASRDWWVLGRLVLTFSSAPDD